MLGGELIGCTRIVQYLKLMPERYLHYLGAYAKPSEISMCRT